MSGDVRQRLIGILAYHHGGWIDNGKPDKCHCVCGYRPTLGEFHGRHVADALLSLPEIGMSELSERMLLAADILEEFNTTYSDIYNPDAHWRPSELRREAAHRRAEENPDE